MELLLHKIVSNYSLYTGHDDHPHSMTDRARRGDGIGSGSSAYAEGSNGYGDSHNGNGQGAAYRVSPASWLE